MSTVLYQGRFLTFAEDGESLLLAPTEEGLEEAIAGSTFEDMIEDALGNGWSMVPPVDIGALTEAPIISRDGFIDDDGNWRPYGDRASVYAHMNYAVEDPVATWADGKPVRLVRATLERP